MTTPIIPGINRAARRRMERAQGVRGSKAKRQNPDRSAHANTTAEAMQASQNEAQAEAMNKAVEQQRRQSAREHGLLMPPSDAEMAHLKAKGLMDHDPRLWVPGD